MKSLINVVETYRLDTQEEVDSFIAESKDNAFEEGYTLSNYSSTLKEKKQKGEVIDSGYLVKISKTYNNFWEC